ncbi:MAG: aspartate aminotransferase family protein [Acidimicrobiales bacterium]|nr:aspartate aminotransferase family protein [Acidimicrobiales bacterium]
MAATAFPAEGTSPDDLLAELRSARGDDLDWRGGKAFSLVYNVGDEGLETVLHDVAALYLHENALNPFAFPSLLNMEQEIVAMAADLLGGSANAGALTSGGTESIFLAVQTAREHARTARGIAEPQIITANTAHPAFEKACHYLDVERIVVPVGADLRLDVEAVADAIGPRTALVVGSSPCYPYGVIDPIADLASLAESRGVLCHVDACLGGWLLPFWERLGEPVPPWDLRVPGVTSLSADVHKYGYTFKGASVVLYRDRALLQHQFFLFDDWPGGLYGSATTAGTRPAAPIAGAWAAIRYLGLEGYLRLAGLVRDTTRTFQEGIGALPGLAVTGDPDMSVFEFSSSTDDIAAIGDVMDDRGWKLDRQQGGLHLMVSPGHAAVADRFLDDLAHAVAHHGESRGTDAVYGGIA